VKKVRVAIDEIDLKIFEIIKRDGETTTTKIAKEIFNPQDDYELRKKDSFIRKRLKKWNDLGVISFVKRASTSYYKFPLKKIFFGKGKIEIVEEERKFCVELGNLLALNTKYGWLIIPFKSNNEV
jgi:hypothetical protein